MRAAKCIALVVIAGTPSEQIRAHLTQAGKKVTNRQAHGFTDMEMQCALAKCCRGVMPMTYHDERRAHVVVSFFFFVVAIVSTTKGVCCTFDEKYESTELDTVMLLRVAVEVVQTNKDIFMSPMQRERLARGLIALANVCSVQRSTIVSTVDCAQKRRNINVNAFDEASDMYKYRIYSW